MNIIDSLPSPFNVELNADSDKCCSIQLDRSVFRIYRSQFAVDAFVSRRSKYNIMYRKYTFFIKTKPLEYYYTCVCFNSQWSALLLHLYLYVLKKIRIANQITRREFLQAQTILALRLFILVAIANERCKYIQPMQYIVYLYLQPKQHDDRRFISV